jgi:acetyl esterase
MRRQARAATAKSLVATGIALSLAVAVATLAACSFAGPPTTVMTPTSTEPEADLGSYPSISVIPDVAYGQADGAPLLLDACLPLDETSTASPIGPTTHAAVLLVHGGSWAHGDKAAPEWRTVCQWLASEGFVAFSINYRLAPASHFPAQIDDVRTAVEWLRQPQQVARFAIDPTRIGAMGGSAGGNLVALLGTTGEGVNTTADRVAAVVDLSGPIDLTDAGRKLGGLTQQFERVQLRYLDCASLKKCPQATDASPLYHVDPTDPPFFVANSTDELIPIEQSQAFVKKLRANGVVTTFVIVKGIRHSLGILDESLRDRIAVFLRENLGDTGAIG